MPKPLTRAQLLAEEVLQRPLAEYVIEKRSQERPTWSWQNIADQLAADTAGKVSVSAEALRLWYGTEVAA